MVYKPVGVFQSLSHGQLFVIPWTTAPLASLSLTISQSLLKFMSTESVTPSNLFILCCLLLLMLSISPSIKIFSNESALCIRWPKYCNFSFSINPANEYSALISFRIDWLDLLAVQGTLKSLLQHHNLKVSILWLSAFIVHLSHPYMTTEKTITLIVQPLLAKWCLCFLTHTYICHSFPFKEQVYLIPWLQSPSSVILEPKKIKSATF